MEKVSFNIKKLKNENGDILVIFAGVFILIVFCLALVIDVGMIYVRKNQMQDVCQVIREDRFTYEDSVRYSENPAVCCFDGIFYSARKNGFDGQIKVYFKEEEPESNRRSYKTRTVLTEKYEYTFAKILGFNETEISVSIDVDETYGEGRTDMIWHPTKSVSTYNGLYESFDRGDGHSFISGEIPSDW